MAELKKNSNAITTGPNRAPARSMLKAVGFTDEDLRKPIVGVANTWIEIGPCNYHLRRLSQKVKEGIRAAGVHLRWDHHGCGRDEGVADQS